MACSEEIKFEFENASVAVNSRYKTRTTSQLLPNFDMHIQQIQTDR